MKIEQYISQLLYRYQCVTVPGFGAFLTEIQSAQIHESSHSFFPPKKVVSFNAYLKNNDGLLASHIAQCEKMSYEVAVIAIENQVTIWKNKLQDFEGIILKNIGEIVLNADKNLVFIPYNQVNYLTESFGLATYVSPTIKREILKELEQKQEEIVLDKEEAIAFIPERRSYNYLKYAAVFVLGLGVLGTLGFNYYETKVAQDTLVVQTNVQKQVNQKIQEATFFISNPIPSVTLTVKSDKLPYHIVAGVFSKDGNATREYNSLLKLGYEARRVGANKKGYFPVLYGSFSSYAEAQKLMNKIKKTHNPEAWLLIEEL
jgi:hypothetical protein